MNFINVTSVLNSNFALGIMLAIIFLEVALPLVIGLPGDTLLLTGGLFAAGIGVKPGAHHISIWGIALLTPIAAFAGSQCGHLLGWFFGEKIFTNPNSKIFSQEKLESAEKWMLKYGRGKAIFLGRFVPVARGLINPLSGMLHTSFKQFASWNLITSIVWSQSFIWLGYGAGRTWGKTIEKYITPIILIVAAITIIPLGLEIIKEYRSRKHLS